MDYYVERRFGKQCLRRLYFSLQDYCGKVTDGLLADIDELPVGSALGAHWMQFAPEDSSSSLNEVGGTCFRVTLTI